MSGTEAVPVAASSPLAGRLGWWNGQLRRAQIQDRSIIAVSYKDMPVETPDGHKFLDDFGKAIAIVFAVTHPAPSSPSMVKVSEWKDALADIVRKCEVGAAFGDQVSFNKDGAQALGELLTNIAKYLDRAIEVQALAAIPPAPSVSERQQIVAWLDDYRGGTAFQDFCKAIPDRGLAINLSAMFKREMRNLADAIERGDHIAPPDKQTT